MNVRVRLRTVVVVLLLGFIGLMSACSDMTTIGYEDPEYPIHHERPVWSSQGLIAYVDKGIVKVDADGGYNVSSELRGIWVIDPDSKAKSQLTSFGWAPSWSPDGQRLAFVERGHIYTIDLDGANPTQLTDEGISGYPSWSPDGQWIAFLYQKNIQENHSLRKIHVDSIIIREVISNEVRGRQYPCWSPDGRYILYVRYVEEDGGWNLEIFAYDTVLGVDNRLTHTDYDERHPRFSPDGSRIAFTGGPNGRPSFVGLVEADGSNVGVPVRKHAQQPAWSPDGTKIVFVRQDYARRHPGNGVLWIKNVVNGRGYQLTYHW